MTKEVQKIKSLVEKLSKYIKPGQKFSGLGMNLQNDIDEVTHYRNHLKSSSDFSTRYEKQLDEILKVITSTNFKDATEQDRIVSITGVIELLNTIASSIDKEASSHE